MDFLYVLNSRSRPASLPLSASPQNLRKQSQKSAEYTGKLQPRSERNNGKAGEKRARYGKDELFAAALLIPCDKSRPMMQSRQTTSPTSEVNGCHRFIVQCSAKLWSPGLVLAYHFCLDLPAAFTQPGDHLIAEPCSIWTDNLSILFSNLIIL